MFLTQFPREITSKIDPTVMARINPNEIGLIRAKNRHFFFLPPQHRIARFFRAGTTGNLIGNVPISCPPVSTYPKAGLTRLFFRRGFTWLFYRAENFSAEKQRGNRVQFHIKNSGMNIPWGWVHTSQFLALIVAKPQQFCDLTGTYEPSLRMVKLDGQVFFQTKDGHAPK